MRIHMRIEKSLCNFILWSMLQNRNTFKSFRHSTCTSANLKKVCVYMYTAMYELEHMYVNIQKTDAYISYVTGLHTASIN